MNSKFAVAAAMALAGFAVFGYPALDRGLRAWAEQPAPAAHSTAAPPPTSERKILYYRNPMGLPDTSPAPPKAQAASPRKILYYRNPMGLPDTSTVPKKDPMGMDYVAVYEGDDADDGTVKLSPGKIQRAGVKSESVTRRSIRVSVKAPGTIQLDERRVSVIAMRAESFVQKVADVTTGTRVKAGQPLMEIYSSAVASAAAEYLATITSKTVGGVEMYGRGSRQRLVNLDVPESVIAEMDKTHTAPVAIRWSAPRDGVVLERNAIEGMRANPGDVLLRIADTSFVWAMVDVA
jgi:Cu(I)/Ag(I) efflux system membrane fusion protein